MFSQKKDGNLLQTLIVGICFVVLILPWATKALTRDEIDLNGLVLSGLETVMEVLTQRDVNLGDPARVDDVYNAPGQ
jgi:hypothetical protein